MPRKARSIYGKKPAKERRSEHAPSGFAFARNRGDTVCMLTTVKTVLLLSIVLFPMTAFQQNTAELSFPEHYREWVYLTSGFDMSYNPGSQASDHHTFDNVFVNPEAYEGFLKTGTWPDKTTLVLELRGAAGKGSINQRGNYQGETMGVEVHVRDEARFPGKWAFFGFDDGRTAKMIPTSADCYSCHAAHGAVDTTFVQFYPTLLPIAKSRGTLAAAYQKETGTPAR